MTRWLAVPVMALAMLGGCERPATTRDAQTGDSPRAAAATVSALEGAGATFPYPVYTRWFSRFGEENGVRINYRSVGSGAGLQALHDGTVDFAATDAPLSATDRERLASQAIRQVPLVVGGAAVSYHIPGLVRQLRLDGELLGDIFLGRITRWNDARLVALNPDVIFPAADIRLVVRGDSSGTSWIVTDYLSRVSSAWATGPGRSTFPAWPVGARVRGNEGVAAELKATEFSLGVVEAVYAMQNRASGRAHQESRRCLGQPADGCAPRSSQFHAHVDRRHRGIRHQHQRCAG